MSESGSGRGLVGCAVGAQRFALDAGCVASIEHAESMRRERGAGARIGALASAAGDVPVVGLAQKLNLDAPRAGSGHVLILERPGGARLGVLVERASRIGQGELARFPIPAALRQGAAAPFEAVLRGGDEMTLLLSPDFLWASSLPARARFAPQLGAKRRTWAAAPQAWRGRLLTFSPAELSLDQKPLKLGVSLAQVLDISSPLPILRVPLAPLELLGLALWRDRPIPVIDLSRRLGVDAPGSAPRWLVVRSSTDAESIAAYPIRSDTHLLDLPVAHRIRAGALPFADDMAHLVAELEDSVLALIDTDAIAGPGTAA